eukprot:scaffold23104_cov56-Attheya_sp.AAC.3
MQFDRTIKKECRKTTKQDVTRFRLTVAVIDTKSREAIPDCLVLERTRKATCFQHPFVQCSADGTKKLARKIRARKTIVGF